jgi:rhodanese-related sulfurtransferase
MSHRHLLLLAALATLSGPVAHAAEPASATPAPGTAAAAPAQAVAVQPMSQDALLQQLAQHPDHLILLDVRTPQEFAEGHIAGAVNVPYDQLATRLAEVPKDKDVVLYCRSGRRAGIAAQVLAANGYKRLSHLEGDMIAWTEKGRPVVK